MKNFSYTSDLVEDGKYKIFVKDNLYEMTEKEYQKQKEFCKVVNFWRANPVDFFRDVIGAELLDYQVYAVEGVIRANQSVLVLSRNAGKSTLVALIAMYLTLLYPNMHVVIASSTGGQSIETFSKIISIAKKAIPSFKSLTDIYLSEVKKNQAKSDGFVRDPSSYHFELFNGSDVKTVNSNIDGARGKRANVVIFDESGFIPKSTFVALEPYAVQNNDFSIGSGWSQLDALIEPPKMPNKLIYCSSASNIDSYFYSKFKEAWLNVLAGNDKYFVMDFPCGGVINATMNGQKLVNPLLTQETVDSALRNDKVGALREYLNIFDRDGGENAIIPRSAIIQNSYPYLPELINPDNRSFYVITWDPARRNDNSCCLIGKFYKDKSVGWKCKIVNCIVLINQVSKDKTMLSAPEQVDAIKRLIVTYNGDGVADYENILGIQVDSGSGGAGVNMTDFLCSDYTIDNKSHRGLIDPEYNTDDAKKWPNAVKDKLHLISPKTKPEMYEAAIQMIAQKVVEFPEDYNSNGHIDLIYEIDKDGNKKQRYTFPSEDEEKKLKKNGASVDVVRVELNEEQEQSLTQINMLKTELVNIWRFTSTNGASRFDLSPDKANIMHDDRAYCFVLMMKFLSDLRRKPITSKKRPDTEGDFVDELPIKDRVIKKMF